MNEENIIRIQSEILQNQIKEMNRISLLSNELMSIQNKLHLYQVQGKHRITELNTPPCRASTTSYNTQWEYQKQIDNIRNKIDTEKIPNYIPKNTEEYWQMNGIKGKHNGWENIGGNYFKK